MLQGAGAILDVARRVSRLLSEPSSGAIIGGVAVTLHGHVRTTRDVDVYVPEPLSTFADQLRADGFAFDGDRHEFSYGGVPVHLVSGRQAMPTPTHFLNIDDVRTVSLADLINLKLQSGTRSLVRAQDLADVIGLIRHHGLDVSFTSRIAKALRPRFCELVRAVQSAQKDEHRVREPTC